MNDNLYIRVPKIVLFYLCGFSLIGGLYILSDKPNPRIEYGPVVIEESNLTDELVDRELVKCEFDKPITHLTFIMKYYDDYDSLNLAYQKHTEGKDTGEVWGWSTCLLQPEDDWAACDIHMVYPKYVHTDMAIETFGHEGYHGACGDYHK